MSCKTDRDRLIELIHKAHDGRGRISNYGLADYLLANGVFILPEDLRGTEDFSISTFIEATQMYKEKDRYIKLPCKVGDMVYIPWTWDGQQGVGCAEVEEIKIYDNKNHIMFFIDLESDDEEFEQQYGGWKLDKSIGDTIFLTKEEAEAKLKEREGK